MRWSFESGGTTPSRSYTSSVQTTWYLHMLNRVLDVASVRLLVVSWIFCITPSPTTPTFPLMHNIHEFFTPIGYPNQGYIWLYARLY